MIVRGPRKERGFTILDNAVLRDKRLSFKARGLLGFLLSQPPNYAVRSESLAADGPDGRDAVRSALAELEVARYLIRQRQRGAGGRFEIVSTVYEEPQPSPDEPSSVRPAETRESAGQAADGFSGAGESGLFRRTEVEVLEKDSSAPATPKREKDPLWESILEACQVRGPITTGARKAYNRAAKELREVGATPEEVYERAGRFRRRWPDVSLTPTALARRWSELAVEPVSGRRATPVDRGIENIRRAREIRDGSARG